jgi:hypothetical protein
LIWGGGDIFRSLQVWSSFICAMVITLGRSMQVGGSKANVIRSLFLWTDFSMHKYQTIIFSVLWNTQATNWHLHNYVQKKLLRHNSKSAYNLTCLLVYTFDVWQFLLCSCRLHLKNEKSVSWMNALFCWKESALFAVVKTLKGHFGCYRDSMFSS